MKSYEEIMNEEGIARSRTPEIEVALDKLHHALSKCDYSNRRAFFAKSIEDRLREFAKTQGIADVTDTGSKKAIKPESIDAESEQVDNSNEKILSKCYMATLTHIAEVTKNEPGYREISRIDIKNPDAHEDAKRWCDNENRKLGLNFEDVGKIVDSSIREQILREQINNSKKKVVKVGDYSLCKNTNDQYLVVGVGAEVVLKAKSMCEAADYAKAQTKINSKTKGQSI